MRVVFDWGNINRLTVDAQDRELAEVARFVAETCEKRPLEVIQLRVLDTPEIRKLFADHLCNMKFGLLEHKETADGPVVGIDLMYKRRGWTMGPCAENNWGQDG